MKSFYKKYRPQIFDEVIGQNVAKKILINSIKENKINHAYLFYGVRGTGKTTLARIFSKSLNCKNIDDKFNPCNKCNACKEISNSSSLDVIEIDAASNNGVSEIRTINENVNYSTTSLKYKIYIIDEVHMLSKSAFNALLKTLEEPPENTIFLLATTEINRIPETILSRTIIINLNLLSEEEISKHLIQILKKEKVSFEQEGIKYISIIAGGSLRDAISFMETVLLFAKDLTQKNVLEVLGLVSFDDLDAIFNKNKEMKDFFTNDKIDYKNVEEEEH